MSIATAYAGDCTFGAVAFLVDEPSALSKPQFGSQVIKGVRSVPYASPARSIVQVTGRDLAQLTLAVTIVSADFASLFAKIGTTDTLTLVGESAVSGVLLDSITNVEHEDIGITHCSAVFVSL